MEERTIDKCIKCKMKTKNEEAKCLNCGFIDQLKLINIEIKQYYEYGKVRR